MPAWKGDPTNPVPNPVQESMARSEKLEDANRALPVRRDTDKQKDQRITFYDVDETILKYLEKMQFSVVDEGNTIKVPIFYGSPEKWVAARKFGYIRDKQGKVQLPAMIFRRTTSENDDNMEMFNRYLKYPVVQKNSVKNKYTQFSILTSQNAPLAEIFNITMADHMVFTYSFIVWTEYHEQMNTIVEKIKFNTKDYWGSERGFRFRTRVDNFSHTVELQADEDRIVKTEFDLVTYGYILPESYQLLDRQYPTTDKLFTKKKIIMGMEVVGTDAELAKHDTSKKWKSKLYPNLDTGDEPPGPSVTWGDAGRPTPPNKQTVKTILASLQAITSTEVDAKSMVWQQVPKLPNSPGKEGWMAYDENFLYIYSGGIWRRVALDLFS